MGEGQCVDPCQQMVEYVCTKSAKKEQYIPKLVPYLTDKDILAMQMVCASDKHADWFG